MKRRLILKDANGIDLFAGNFHRQLDASDVPNASSMIPIYIAVEEMCNLGDWHQTQFIKLDPWGES